MSSPQSVSRIDPVSSWTVASATRDGPREVVTSRGVEIAVIVPSIVPFEFAFSEAMLTIGRGRARGGLSRFPPTYATKSMASESPARTMSSIPPTRTHAPPRPTMKSSGAFGQES
jgi:hypothetical protein